MKIHLPLGLRSALMLALMGGALIQTASATTYPVIQEVTVTAPGEGGESVSSTHTYINVGRATQHNKFNGVNLPESAMSAPDADENSPIVNNVLVVEDGDLVGMFANDVMNAESFVTNLEKTYRADSEADLEKYNISASLILDGDLKISGSGKVYLGGKSGKNHYSGLDAKNVLITADATGTNNENSLNLRADTARMETFTINEGSAYLRAYLDSGDYSYGPGLGGSWKSVGISKGLYVNGGFLRMGRQGNGSSQTGGQRNQKNSHFMTCLRGEVKQTSGEVQMWGKTYMNVPLLEQSGGSMLIAYDPTAAYDYLNLGAASTTFLQNGDADTSLTIDGMIIKGASGTSAMKLVIDQSGAGTITLNQGIMFKSSGDDRSLIKQTGTGKIHLKGDYTSASFDIEQSGGTITLYSGAKMNVHTADIGGSVVTNGNLAVQDTLIMRDSGSISGSAVLAEGAALGFTPGGTTDGISADQYGNLTYNGSTLTLKLYAGDTDIVTGQAYALLKGSASWLDKDAPITVSGITYKASDLYWDGDTLYYQRTQDVKDLTVAEWNPFESNEWNKEDLNWVQDEIGYNYEDNVEVHFTDTGAGTVQLMEDVVASTVKVEASQDYTWEGEGSLTGDSKLEKSGTGTLTINNANSYAGDTTIDGGSLVVSNDAALGESTVTVNNGATLKVSTASMGNEVKLDGGTLQVSRNNTGGKVSVLAASDTTTKSTLTIDKSRTYTVTETIRNEGNLTIAGAGNIKLADSMVTTYGQTRIDTDGVDTKNQDGFLRDAGSSAQLVESATGASVDFTLTGTIKDSNSKSYQFDEATGMLQSGGGMHYNQYEMNSSTASAGVKEIVDIAAQNGTTETDIEVNGGSLFVDADAVTGDLKLSGTGLVLLEQNATVKGDITLAGGSVDMQAYTLSTQGTLNLEADTQLDISDYQEPGAHKLIEFDSKVGALSLLSEKNSAAQNRAAASSTVERTLLATDKAILAYVTGPDKNLEWDGSLGPLQEGTISDKNLIASGDNTLIAATVTGTSSVLLKNGNVTLTANNDYSGGTFLQGGNLMANASALGSGPVHFQGGSLTTDSLRSAAGITVEKDKVGSVVGNLTLNGGHITLGAGGLLMVQGEVALENPTVISADKGSLSPGDALISYSGKVIGNTGNLTLDYMPGYDLAWIQGAVVLRTLFSQTDFDLPSHANWGTFTGTRTFMQTVQAARAARNCINLEKTQVWFAAMGNHRRLGSSPGLTGADISLYGGALGVARMFDHSFVGLSIGCTTGEVKPFATHQNVDQFGSYLALYSHHRLVSRESAGILALSLGAAYGNTESESVLTGRSVSWSQNSILMSARVDWQKKISENALAGVFGGLEYYASDSDNPTHNLKTGSIQNLRAELGITGQYRIADATLFAELSYFNDVARNNPIPAVYGYRGRGSNPGRQGVGVNVGAVYDFGHGWSGSAHYSFESMQDSREHSLNFGAHYCF